MDETRRGFLRKGATGASVAAAAATGLIGAGNAAQASTEVASGKGQGRPYPDVSWPEDVQEGPDTPKLCQWFSRFPSEAEVRNCRQAGIRGAVVTDVPDLPWDVETLRSDRYRIEALGMDLTCYLISAPDNVIRGTEGRDSAIRQIKQSISAAGKAGIEVVEYNWYVHRLSEGYYEIIDEDDRLGAGYTGFDYNRLHEGVPVRDLPREPGTPEFTHEELWDNYEHFLREVIPVAEAAGVRMAVHPNDPPAKVSRGNPQVLATKEDWIRLVETVDSPANGMTAHVGYFAEMGVDDIEFLRYLGSKDRINHVHYRNVRVDEPGVKYAEVFPDNGDSDMFGFMRELIRQGYSRGILAEHPRALDYDRENDAIGGQYADVGGGGPGGDLYDFGYARAMMQAALVTERYGGR